MFEVTMNTINNPFKPEIIDSTTIILKQSKPFVQMSYKYDGDLTNLTDGEAIQKVLDDFYNQNYEDKIQEGKLTELELAFAKQKEKLEETLTDLVFQNELTSQAVIELTEILLGNTEDEGEEELEPEVEEDEEVDEPEESEEETDGSNSDVDGDENPSE